MEQQPASTENQENLPSSERAGGADVYPAPVSPRWSATTKLTIGLTLAAIGVFLVFRFLNILGPLLLAFILAYLFYPLAEAPRRYLHIPWRLSVTLLYLIVLVLLLGLMAAGGVAIFEQVQSLISFLDRAIANLPQMIENLVATPLRLGPFILQLNALDVDVTTLTGQISGVVQPLLATAGSLVGTFASSAAVVIGWTFFILLISYFILAESGGVPNLLLGLDLPGHTHDLQRLSSELGRIWNAFLRGQLTIVLITILVYIFVLGTLGVKFFFGLALLAGLARFIPYVGPAIAWTTYGLVAFFQGSTIFGISPLAYVGVVVGTAWVLDMIMDNVVAPRVMADALKVHPATVMVSALIGANLLGVIGVVLAAPVLATVQLFLNYIVRKLLDQDPWAGMQTITPPDTLEAIVPEMQKRAGFLMERFARLRHTRGK